MRLKIPSEVETRKNREAYVKIVYGENIYLKPLWDLENHYIIFPSDGRTGDVWLWDMFQFDRQSSQLLGFSVDFDHPEQRNLERELSQWLSTNPQEGTLRLIGDPRDIIADLADYQWFHPDGKLMAGLYAAAMEAPSVATRLRIAHDFDLLFSERGLCGWIMWNPTTHLTFDWETYEDGPEAELVSLMQDYLRITTVEANVRRLHSKDPGMFEELLSLFRLVDIEIDTVSRKHAIREGVSSLLERFYGHYVDEQKEVYASRKSRPRIPKTIPIAKTIRIEQYGSEQAPLPDASDILSVLPPPFEWCKIPTGQVRLDDDDAGAYEVQAFWMAKYLITFEQFQVFVNDRQGFTNADWWEDLAADAGHRRAPGAQHFTGRKNLPRENVSWYDAMVFCRWLSVRVGYEIRLPAEWEWQWAAQGPEARAYPWGDDYIQGYANINEVKSQIESGVYLEKTTPVDSYPQGASPYGVLGMSGNVWEWCLSKYHFSDKCYSPEKSNLAGSAGRGMRGGSWYDFGILPRCSFRSMNFPHYRSDTVGFRVLYPVSKMTGTRSYTHEDNRYG